VDAMDMQSSFLHTLGKDFSVQLHNIMG